MPADSPDSAPGIPRCDTSAPGPAPDAAEWRIPALCAVPLPRAGSSVAIRDMFSKTSYGYFFISLFYDYYFFLCFYFFILFCISYTISYTSGIPFLPTDCCLSVCVIIVGYMRIDVCVMAIIMANKPFLLLILLLFFSE